MPGSRRNAASQPGALTPRAAVLATVAAATCAPEPPAHPFLDLVPVAVSSVPLTRNPDVALVSETTACIGKSYQTRVYCVDRTGRVVGDFGREGDGPGEFNGVTKLARGPDGTIGVFDWGLSRMTVFMPDGTMVSETKVPRLFAPARSFQSSVSGYSHTIPSPSELSDVSNHRDATNGRLVKSPTYVPEFPNDRDLAAYLEEMRFAGPLPPELLKSYEEEYRAEPKVPFLGTGTLVYDSGDRLWYATTRDRDNFSYLDVWVGTT